MIMLSAAAAVAAPRLATQFDADCRAFHVALATDRSSAIRAAAQLSRATRALSNVFAAHDFGRGETIGILGHVVSDARGARYTDYAGSAQAVMAIDTLLNALVTSGQLDPARAQALRPDIDRAYRAVSDPNGYRPAEFRAAIARIALAARTLG
jgi:hypothetical protein